MKISYFGFQTFKLDFDKISILTDVASYYDAGFNSREMQGDILVYTDPKLIDKGEIISNYPKAKIVNQFKDKTFEIANPGEFEIGEVMIRRDIGKSFYIFDEGYTRVVYVGFVGKDFNPSELKDLGDVDALILPVGDGELFPETDKIEKIISYVDPTYLIPSGYAMKGIDENYAKLRTVEDFLKEEGYTVTREEKTLKFDGTPESEDKKMEVILLNKI